MRPDASLANERVVLEKEFAMMLRATAGAMAIEKKEGTGVPPFSLHVVKQPLNRKRIKDPGG
jgi:hypothetical protein